MSLRPIPEAELHALADGYATAARRAEIAAYLEADREAAKRMADWCAQNDAIRRTLGKIISQPLPDPPAAAEPVRLERFLSVPSQKMVAVGASKGGAETPGMLRQRRRIRRFSPFGLVCSGLLVGLLAGWMGAIILRVRPVSPVAQSVEAADIGQDFVGRAIAAHREFATDTLFTAEISTRDRARLTLWLGRHLGENLALPDLGPAGYRLVAGRIVSTSLGSAAMLLFANAASEKLSLIFAPSQAAFDRSPQYQDERGTGAVLWQQAGHVLTLAGPPERDRLVSLAQRIMVDFKVGELSP